ncbi:MAG: ChbG/HpnK family deacetylase [Candidatus Helarchaeota archaeon]|nr:ChbG/HpnK family deacetylase [Candidatus Helarchaeota archaeon]
MLIINADDLGKTETATDNTIACYSQGLITSASAMVFMKDSQRAAELAATAGLETGLHLNLTLTFDGQMLPLKLREHHLSIVSYFRSSKWTQIIYNPFLKKKLDYIFRAQYDEYCRLFFKEPAQIDGHHHMHLCINIILGGTIPPGLRVRRNFSFSPGEKDIINRFYRRLIDKWLVRRYCCTDSFFSLETDYNLQRLSKIVSLAFSSDVELMLHPEKIETYRYLMRTQYRDIIANVHKGNYRMLSRQL